MREKVAIYCRLSEEDKNKQNGKFKKNDSDIQTYIPGLIGRKYAQ